MKYLKYIDYINNNFKSRVEGVCREAAQIGVIKYRAPFESKFELVEK